MPSRRLAFQPSSDRTLNKSSAGITFQKRISHLANWRNVFSGFGRIEVLLVFLPSKLRRNEPTSQVAKAFSSCLALG